MPLNPKSASLLLLAAYAMLARSNRAPCAKIHIIAARETAKPPGYGSSGAMVNLIVSVYPATSEAIDYPACGAGSECGNVTYAESVRQGTWAVAAAVNRYAQRCPRTKMILVGYSQGAHIIDNALCGGGDPAEGITDTAPTINFMATPSVEAVVLMGNPRWEFDAYYNVGSCRARGFDPRPKGFECLHGDVIQSYCDSQDLFCCNGTSLDHHGRYVEFYGEEVLAFVEEMIYIAEGDPNRQNEHKRVLV